MLIVLGLLLVARLIVAAELNFKLPPENNRLRPGPGSEIATVQCVICHSTDYITTQPPMPRAFWKAGVQKMQKIYGAPIPDEQVEPVVDYLVKNYGNEKSSGAAPASNATPGK